MSVIRVCGVGLPIKSESALGEEVVSDNWW